MCILIEQTELYYFIIPINNKESGKCTGLFTSNLIFNLFTEWSNQSRPNEIAHYYYRQQ
ncbi:hypothetical protein Bache_1185 [Bacteroides helcogenes P 36-108]|uniref:Uncharacterized protein n=1 Tax=Bacteroides helcogenes (strain ATCC 35417 / DSM 20613 / JCM 6297 / CCUG 15421 / P 36-108) TaxID=693979 RepID=E6SST2_BACT6|nr:hypothetical protein Bache_1185 [Bacteroides helcogenes P 36-108]